MKTLDASTKINFEERVAFDIATFCYRNSMSRSKYNDLKNKGLGPDELDADGLLRITLQAEREWQERCTNPGTAAAATDTHAARRKRGSKAGKLAAASPKHISHQRKAAAAAKRQQA